MNVKTHTLSVNRKYGNVPGTTLMSGKTQIIDVKREFW